MTYTIQARDAEQISALFADVKDIPGVSDGSLISAQAWFIELSHCTPLQPLDQEGCEFPRRSRRTSPGAPSAASWVISSPA